MLQFSFTDIQQIVNYFLVFCRIGAAMALIPGISHISVRIKLLFVILLSFVVYPIIYEYFDNKDHALISLLREIFIGCFIGITINIIFAAINIAANIISSQIGLSSVFTINQNTGEQDVILSNFFTLLIITALVVTDNHYLLIFAIVRSYDLLQFQPNFLEDSNSLLIQVAEQSFIIALQVSAIFTIIGTLLYLVICLLGRLVPQIQFFFISMPLQIWLGLLLLALTLYGAITFYLYSEKGIIAALKSVILR